MLNLLGNLTRRRTIGLKGFDDKLLIFKCFAINARTFHSTGLFVSSLSMLFSMWLPEIVKSY